ncbi:MAG: twin-arginine translocation signal domain-containing protein, partial [Candidatus Aminicenantes bacterium]
MSQNRMKHGPQFQPHCCPHEGAKSAGANTLTRRTFLKGMGATAIGGMALSGLSWPLLSAEGTEMLIEKRVPLKVKPILVYSTPVRRHQTSWRAWGAIQTQRDVDEE